MIKKFSKYLLLIICCFIGITSVSAREMTKEEFAELLHEMRPKASYVYVVGEYAFTSSHEFTREDNLLATRSIKLVDKNGKTDKDPIYDEMIIYRYGFQLDEDFNNVVDSFKWEANMAGNKEKQLSEKFNIRYVDYVFIPDISKAEIEKAGDAAYKKLKDKYGIDFKNDDNLIQNIGDSKNVELSGKIFYNDDEKIDENIFDEKDLTGYYYTFVVKVDNLKDDTVVFIDGKKYTKADFDENGELVALVALHPENETAKKNVQIKVDLDGDGKDYIESTYTIDYSKVQFKKVLDVDKAVRDNMKAEDSDVLATTLNNGTLSMNQIGVVDPLNTTTGSALINALRKTLNTDGVKSIKLSYNGKDYELTESNLESKIAELLKDVAGKDYDKAIQNDVIGKSIKMTVNLEDGNISIVTPDEKSTVEYTIDFTGTKAEETKFTVLVDKNNSAYTDSVKQWLNSVNFKFDYANLTLTDGKLTGVVLENKDVGAGFSSLPEDITGYYFTYVIKLDKNVTDATTVILPGNGSTKVVRKDSFDTADSMVVMFALKPKADDKTFDITVDYDGDGKGYLPTTYTIDYSDVVFKKVLDVDKIVSDNMKAEDSDVLATTLNNGKISMDQIGVVDPLNTTTGSALINALRNTLNTDGVKSIKLNYNGKDYELTESDLESKVAEMLKDVAGKDYDKAIQNDVIGKSIKMTVNLEDGKNATVTPDGKSTVEYTIDFTGTKAEETNFTVSVDKNDPIYNKDSVKDFLNNAKYNALDTNLTLVDGKLTGTILENKTVGDGFSTRPEDITDYYFTYVITLDEPVTDATIITLPGDGSTKIVKSDAFDSDKSIVIMHALKPDAINKSFDITVDYDGDGKGYLPKTYTIDYTGVKFLSPEDMLKLAAENTEKVGKYESKTVVAAEDINGNKATSSYDSKSDFLNKVMYLHSKNADNEEEFGYITEKDGILYSYYSMDNITWIYMKTNGSADWTPTGLLDELFPDYKKVERVEATEEGTIKLAVTHTITSVENNDENENTVYEPVNDAISYVTIKDNKLVRIDTDLLALFEEEVQDRFKYFTQEIQISNFTGNFEIPEDVVNNAILFE